MAGGIKRVKIRAKIEIGSLKVETPYILSFTVTKTRGQSSTFSTSLKVNSDDISGSISGAEIVISAGVGSASEKIFTGIVKKLTVSPCFDDPKYVILNVSGNDVLSMLEGKKFTRRCRATKSSWVSITSVNRKGPRTGKLRSVGYAPNIRISDGDSFDTNSNPDSRKSDNSGYKQEGMNSE